MVDPETVLSPKWAEVEVLEVLVDTGEDGYSIIRGKYEGEERVGIRYNGGEKRPQGFPTSQGKPVWFWLPSGVDEVIEDHARMSPFGYSPLVQ